MSDKRIGIVGAGPIGGILSAYLVSAGEQVVLVDILEDHLEAIRTTGLRVTGHRDFHVVVPDVVNHVSKLADYDLDHVVIAVKVGRTPEVLSVLREFLAPDVVVSSFQNGLHSEQPIAEVFGEDRTLRAVLNNAGHYVGPGELRFTFFQKANSLGAMSPAGRPKAEALAARLNAAGMDTEVVDDIVVRDWEKVILNVILGPICAIADRTMKDTLALAGVPELSDGLLRECIDVARAEGLEWDPGFYERCRGFIRKAGPHVPSMLADVRAGRETEIDSQCGAMAALGREHGIPTPYNATVTTLVKAIST